MTWDKNIAKLFKNRDNPPQIGPVIGKVITSAPNVKVSIFEGKVILEKRHLYINENLMTGFTQSVESNGTIDLSDGLCGETNYTSNHKHSLETLEVTDGPYSFEGELILKDALVKGDEVLLLPTNNNQKFFIICKVKKLGD